MWLLLTVVLAQPAHAPPPWSAPLAPALTGWKTPEPTPPVTRATFLQTIARGAYQSYRVTLSTAKGDNCRFAPSCSLYGHQAIEKVGLVFGLVLFGARLMRGHVNFDRFYRFDGARLLDPLEDTLDWLVAPEETPRWRSLQRSP